MTGEQYYAALLAAGLAAFSVITLAVIGRETGRRLATRIHPATPPAPCGFAFDHDTCRHPDCGVALCPWPCNGHQQPACPHGHPLCDHHASNCSQCLADIYDEGSDW